MLSQRSIETLIDLAENKLSQIIPFDRDYLLEYNNMEQTPLEIIESVDMMRIIENGMKVKMIYTPKETYAVDNEDDLKLVVDKMKSDPLLGDY